MKITSCLIHGIEHSFQDAKRHLDFMTLLCSEDEIEFSDWKFIEQSKHGPCWQAVIKKTVCDPETLIQTRILNVLTIRTENADLILALLNNEEHRYGLSLDFIKSEDDTGGLINFTGTDVWYSVEFKDSDAESEVDSFAYHE